MIVVSYIGGTRPHLAEGENADAVCGARAAGGQWAETRDQSAWVEARYDGEDRCHFCIAALPGFGPDHPLWKDDSMNPIPTPTEIAAGVPDPDAAQIAEQVHLDRVAGLTPLPDAEAGRSVFLIRMEDPIVWHIASPVDGRTACGSSFTLDTTAVWNRAGASSCPYCRAAPANWATKEDLLGKLDEEPVTAPRPEWVKIGPHRYTIRWDGPAVRRFNRETRQDHAGWSSSWTHEIAIAPEINDDTVPESSLRETLVHEILHQAFRVCAARLEEIAKAAKGDGTVIEERVISTLEAPLLGILRDNPHVLAWLTAD